jgi:hypothetical protein
MPEIFPIRISTISVRSNACEPPGTSTVRAPDDVKSPVRAPMPSGAEDIETNLPFDESRTDPFR